MRLAECGAMWVSTYRPNLIKKDCTAFTKTKLIYIIFIIYIIFQTQETKRWNTFSVHIFDENINLPPPPIEMT